MTVSICKFNVSCNISADEAVLIKKAKFNLNTLASEICDMKRGSFTRDRAGIEDDTNYSIDELLYISDYRDDKVIGEVWRVNILKRLKAIIDGV